MQSNEINGNNASLVANRAEIAGAIKADAVAKLNLPSDPAPPLDVLPLFARTLVVEAEKALGINPAYSLSGMIFATAAAIGATHQAEVKKGSIHSACLFMVMVGLPNANKSGGLSFGLKPIHSHDAEVYAEYRIKIKEYNRAVKNGEMPDKPVDRKTIVSDYSRESLATIHLANLRGFVVYSDELSGWIKDMNRYGGGGEESFWLQTWSGKPISVDRKTQEPIRIQNPVISVAGTIQPGPLKELASGGRGNNGFVDRLLFAWPAQNEKALWTDDEIPAELITRYEDAIYRLLSLEFNTKDEELGEGWQPEDNPYLLKFSPAARVKMFDFFNKINKLHCDTSENARLASMHGKFDLLAIRLALVLQMLWYGYQEAGKDAISEATTDRAIRLTEWFRSQSLKVYRHLYENGPLEELEQDEQRLYESFGSSFTTNEAKNISSEKFKWSEKKAQRFLERCLSLQVITRESRGIYSKLF